MNKNKKERIVREINEMFPPTNAEYPVAFIRSGDGDLIVSGETTYKEALPGDVSMLDGETWTDSFVIDYYGEYRGGYSWIDPRLEKYLKGQGLFCEWENPACVIVYEL